LHNALVRPQPAQCGVICDFAGYIPEIGHHGLDAHPLKRFCQHLDCFANERVTVAQRQDET
jgi:hypothetical protein